MRTELAPTSEDGEHTVNIHSSSQLMKTARRFGLDRPSPVNSLTSASSRGQHHRLEQGIEMDREDEWEAKSAVSSDEATLRNEPAAMPINAEKQEELQK